MTDADIMVFNEIWLKASITKKYIIIDAHNVFRTDRAQKKGRGVAIYVKSNLNCSCI